MSVQEHANRIVSELQSAGAKDVSYAEVEAKVKELVENFLLDEDEAAETAIIGLKKKYGISIKGTSKVMTIAEALAAGQEVAKKNAETGEKGGAFATIRAKVIQLYPPKSDTIQQKMQVADASGTTFMTIWVRRPYQNAKTGKETPVVPLPLVEEGQSYEFKNVVTNEFPAGSGRISLQSNSKSTEIVPFEEEIDVKVGEQEIVAPIVAIFDDSGLIKRCTVMVEDDKSESGFKKCGRNYIKGECPVKEHGKQKSEYDIMVRGVLDDGYHTQSFVLNAELTKKLTGIDVDTAKALVVDNAETPSIVADTIREKLMNRYFHVKGFVTAGGRMIVKEISTPNVEAVDMTALKAKLEAI